MFKLKIGSQNLDHGCTKDQCPYQNQDKGPHPNQEPPVSSESPNQDLKDIAFLCTFKINIESLNCSTPSKEKLSCLGEHYYHKILLPVVVPVPVPPVTPKVNRKKSITRPP